MVDRSYILNRKYMLQDERNHWRKFIMDEWNPESYHSYFVGHFQGATTKVHLTKDENVPGTKRYLFRPMEGSCQCYECKDARMPRGRWAYANIGKDELP